MPGAVGPGRARAPEPIDAGLLFCGRCRRDRACFSRCSRRWRRLGRRLAGTGGCSGFARRTAQLAPLLLRQAVVLLPLLLQPLFLVGRQLFHLLIALGDPEPLALARWFEIVPVDRKRRENLLLLLRQLAPRRGLFLRCGCKDGERGAEPKCYCEERFSHASNPLSR